MVIFGYIGALFIGLSLGLIGGGGSILSVPIFVYLFKIQPIEATSYSLFVVGTTALIGSFGYAKQKLVNLKTGISFAIPSFVGVYLVRKVLMPMLPSTLITINEYEITKNLMVMVAFATLMILASYSMIKPRKNNPAQTTQDKSYYIKIGQKGFMVGLVTGFVGAGGGFLIIPALVLLAGLPMKEAVGTSLAIIAANSLFGFFVGSQLQNIDWKFLFTFATVAVIGIIIGSQFSKKVSEQRLKVAFGWFVLIMGSGILLQQMFFKI